MALDEKQYQILKDLAALGQWQLELKMKLYAMSKPECITRSCGCVAEIAFRHDDGAMICSGILNLCPKHVPPSLQSSFQEDPNKQSIDD